MVLDPMGNAGEEGNIGAMKQSLMACGFCLALGCFFSGCAHDPDFGWHDTPYRNPLVSPGAQFAALPPAVQNAVRAQAGSTEIETIEELDTPSGAFYQVRFRQERLYPPLYIAPDGSVMNPDLTVAVGAAEGPGGVTTGSVTDLSVSDLPQRVLRVIDEQVPGAQVDTVHKELWGERDIYIISFKDPRAHPRIYVLSDGTVFKQAMR